MHEPGIDSRRGSELSFRIDNFAVPDESRSEFEGAMRRILGFLESQPGFLGHTVFEKTDGPTIFSVTTIAVWANRETLARAGDSLRAHHRALGLDIPRQLKLWGVRAEQGTFVAPAWSGCSADSPESALVSLLEVYRQSKPA